MTPTSLRARLLGVAVLALLPLVGSFFYTQRTLHRLAEEEFRQGALRLADAASETHRDILRDSRIILQMAAQRADAAEPDAETCEDLFGDVHGESPAFTSFGIVRPDGMTVCIEPGTGPYDLSDRPYFLRALETGRLAVSDYHIGHLTGRPVVTMALPVLDDAGDIVTVLAMGLDLREIRPLETGILPPWASILLFDSQGRTLYTSGAEGLDIGEPVPAFLRTVALAPGHDTVVAPPAEGSGGRTYAVTPLAVRDSDVDLGAYMAVGFQPGALSSTLTRASRPALLGLLVTTTILVLGIGGVVEFLVLRRLAGVVNATERMARGDLTARTDIGGEDEIGRLARTFDEMAENLEEARAVAAVRAQRELHESRERFRLLADTIDDVFWISDPEERGFMYLSPAFEDVWGRPRQDFLDDRRAWTETVHPDDRDVAEQWTDELGRPKEGEYEYRIVRADGETRWIRNQTYVVEGPEGPRYYLGVAQDITEQKALEDALIQSSKLEAVGQLAGGVAHDFNNVLTAIQGHAQLLAEELADEHPGREELDEIQSATGRAASLTRQLLTFSRKQATQPRVLDLDDIVEDLMAMTRRLIGEDIRLEAESSGEAALVHADPNQLEQVLINLTVNARDAMPKGGTLTIRTSVEEVVAPPPGISDPHMEPGEYVTLSVEDTGVGMTADVKERIFEPFFTTKGPTKGTGLGLATVYGVVRQSGGSIRVESEPGEGTTFTVYLPRRREDQVEGPEADVEPSNGRTTAEVGSVLVVEDEAAVRQVVCRNLQRLGFETVGARDGAEALALARDADRSFDLLITDVVMPGMSGPELRAEIARVRPDLPVIFMSGYPGHGERNRMLDPDVAFLQKPFSREVLARTVRSVLDPDANDAARKAGQG